MYDQLQYEVSESIATLTLNRPERLNAWTERMGIEMRDAFARAEKDPAVVVILLTGAGRGFCAGADLETLRSISDGEDDVATRVSENAAPGDPGMGPSFRGPFELVRIMSIGRI